MNIDFQNILAWYNLSTMLLALLLSLYLLIRYYHNHLFQILSLFLFVGGIKIGSHAFILSKAIDPPDWFLRINAVTPLLFAPLLYLFIRLLTKRPAKYQRRDLLHFMPALLYTAVVTPWFFSPEENRFFLIDFQIEKAIANGVTFIQGIVYTILSYRVLSKEEWLLKREYSSIETLSHSWLKWLLTIQIGIWGVAIFTYMVAGSGLQLGIHIDTIIFTTSSIWIYTVIVMRIKQPHIFINKQPESISDEPIGKTNSHRANPTSSALDTLHTDLLTLMEKREPFLQPRLSLADLAGELSCSKHDISFVINQKCECNFYEFINGYRLNRAKELLTVNECEFTVYQIALECGFNSKSSFNTLFKKREKCTPTEFRKNRNKI